jgi:uncharacterized membrane protein (DUF106 family)
MSGPFYGSLAASASVFVAILTALLVNNYVEIKSQRRRVQTQLERVKEKINKVESQRDDHQETIDELTKRRESRFKQNAEERVSKFIEDQIPSQVSVPIEKLDTNSLYYRLSEYHGFDSPVEMEESDENYHRQLLEERYDEIEQIVLEEITSSFAQDYDITGHLSRATGLESDTLKEVIEENEGEKSGRDEDSSSSPEDIGVSAEGVGEEPEPVELDEFIEGFKQEYDLDSLRDETKQSLEYQYEKEVNQSTIEGISDRLDLTSPLEINNPFDGPDIMSGLGNRERARLQEARKDLAHVKKEIETLQSRKERLENKKSGLQEEDLIPIFISNVATIILSVVFPAIAYLLFVMNTVVTVPRWAWIFSHTEVNVFLFWLLGFIIVFVVIYIRIAGNRTNSI